MSTVPNHHLSLPRAIVYQLTGLLGIANGGVTSYALKTYTSRTSLAASMGAKLASADIQAAGGITITAGSLAGVATGLLYIVMMVHPGHSETRRSVLLKETGMVVFTLLFLVAALLSTVVVATKSGVLDSTGLSAAAREQIVAALGGSLAYNTSKPSLAYTVGNWICFVGMVACTILMSRHARHVLANGPAVGAERQFPEKFAAPYLEKAFPKYFPGEAREHLKEGKGVGSESAGSAGSAGSV